MRLAIRIFLSAGALRCSVLCCSASQNCHENVFFNTLGKKFCRPPSIMRSYTLTLAASGRPIPVGGGIVRTYTPQFYAHLAWDGRPSSKDVPQGSGAGFDGRLDGP